MEDAVECQWCGKWEDKDCVKITNNEYTVLDECSRNSVFFCSIYLPKLPIALDVSKVNDKVAMCFQSFDSKISESVGNQIKEPQSVL